MKAEIGEILVHLCARTKGSPRVHNVQNTFYTLLTFRCTSLVPSCALSLGGKGRERGQEEGLGLAVAHSRRDQNSRAKHRSRVPPPAPTRQSRQNRLTGSRSKEETRTNLMGRCLWRTMRRVHPAQVEPGCFYSMGKGKVRLAVKMIRFFFSQQNQKQHQSLSPSATANQGHPH